ncbi:mediator of RNA polymerase II transcription subunit 12-like [Andrographis paniculata]|uniref:mediator of RNA polymerase II transcription subunit 12-like n=1 Tax=Andrographis paniculata TaxID=175694 RepID=UPI0021E7DE5F|nr:mediator of RNA polymerase II transcription subunit 12-like [Andrographis paniculata]
MQRYHTSNCSTAVNSSGIGGIQARDTSRSELPVVSPNFSVNPRRSVQVTPYRLRCDREPLNPRLGPPDFHPQTSNCPEETLTKEYVQVGYRETVEGLEEARELLFSQVEAFAKPVIVKCKESIRKYHRAINESRAQKRKAGQVYGIPLLGTLLTKSGIFPELRPCGEDIRKKWIEGLSQPHKRLQSLANHIPHGYRKKCLFEVLIKNNVPLLRATWYIKVTYLNQVRPVSLNSSSAFHERSYLLRSELWTKDIIEYLQYLLDEFMTGNISRSTLHIQDRSSPIVYGSSAQQKGNSFSAVMDSEEPSLDKKWWYMVRIIHWHHAEGILVPSLIIDWVLNQLQGKEVLGIVQLLLPVLYGIIEAVVLSQTYMHTLAGIAIRLIREPSPGGSDLIDKSRHAYDSSAVVEMLRYLVLAAPDAFVGFDCFPLPKYVVSRLVNDGSFIQKMPGDASMVKDGHIKSSSNKFHGFQKKSLSFTSVVSSIQKRAETLSRAARPNHPSYNVAKALQVLDQSLNDGDIEVAYKLLFENLWNGPSAERWIAEVSPSLQMSLKHISSVTSSLLCSIFFLCEWATCEYRNFRNGPPHGLKFTGRRDLSPIFITLRLLKKKMSNMPEISRRQKSKSISDIFVSPGPMHDIILCWVDQHEVHNKEGFKRLQFLIRQLIRSGVFNPLAYVRQLIVSGDMGGNGPMFDPERQKRHQKLLRELPASNIRDALEEIYSAAEPSDLVDAMIVYSNERRLVLYGIPENKKSDPIADGSTKKKKRQSYRSGAVCQSSSQQWHCQDICSATKIETDAKLEDLKVSISALLQLPISLINVEIDESQRSNRKPVTSINGIDSEEVHGCEECRRAKKMRLSEEMGSSFLHSFPEEEEIWWFRKGMNNTESFKAEPPSKPTKQLSSRGKQKSVRKTQTLAKLSDARIEGSQGASASHVCDNRMGCPHHRSSVDEISKHVDGTRKSPSTDILSIEELLKKVPSIKKENVASWLMSVVKQLIEEAEKFTTKAGLYGRPPIPIDDQISVRWRISDDELSSILYIMDLCGELVSATRFLLWLFPKLPRHPVSSIPSRNSLVFPRPGEKHTCDVTEAFLLSCIRRYENIIVAADLIPETLTATMRHTAAVLASNGRISGSPSLIYSCYLLRKYGSIASVLEWEKSFNSSCDKRLSSELEVGRSLDGGFTLGVPDGEDPDDHFRRMVTGLRVSRVGSSMKEVVRRCMDEVVQHFHSKDRKHLSPGTNKIRSVERWDDGCQTAQKIVMGLMDCMKHTGGAAQEGDPSLVAHAIGAIVNSVGQVVARIPDLSVSTSHSNAPPSGSLLFARHMLRIHITCLCILKEALGERHSRVFEISLATESSSALSFILGKAPRSQYHMSPDSHDFNSNLSNEALNHSGKVGQGTATRISASIYALLVGAILHGVSSLERMVILFKLNEGIDLIQFTRNMKSNVNGNARPMGFLKVDNLIEISASLFRVLVGNCRTVSDGFIVDLLGEASILALSRKQRILPLDLVFPPAYSIFSFVVWRPVLDALLGARDDLQHLYQILGIAMDDAIKHLPFREICLRDTRSLYNLISADSLDSEFVSLLESSSLDINVKAAALVPLRSRLLLDALMDCKIPQSIIKVDDKNRFSGQGELKKQYGENVKKLMGKVVHVLDTLQPARFHLQWVELRLLLNEQAVNEKIENDISLIEAVRSLSPSSERSTSETESNFVQIILTRLLVRPDAAPLFSEVVHLMGKSVEDSLLSQAKWLLRGAEVLYGKKSIRQKIVNIAAELKEPCSKPRHSKPWGWCHSDINRVTSKREKLKSANTALEEGEVVDEGIGFKHSGKGSGVSDVEGFIVSQQRLTERALVALILPCLDRGSNDLRYNFANEMFKQISNIEQQINVVIQGVSKQPVAPGLTFGSPTSKSGNRKSVKSGSPGISRQSVGTADAIPPSPAALRASLTLRLQFLIRLLPVICTDREPSGRKLRYALSTVILRLLGSRVVYEDAGHIVNPALVLSKRNAESPLETSTAAELCEETIFDHLLLVFYMLLSSHQPSWLKPKSEAKTTEVSKDSTAFEREAAENLQNDLDRMEIPETVRWRIQTAMPILSSSLQCSISCQPPGVPPTAVSCLHPSNPVVTFNSSNPIPFQRTHQSLPSRTSKTKPRGGSQQAHLDASETIDQWTLLEDGTGSSQPSVKSTSPAGNSGDHHSNPKASSWLKGAVRIRRTELTYIGAVDEDS